MLGIFFGALILFVIIFTMDGEMPAWLPVIGCVLATVIPTAVVNAMTPAGLFFVGPMVGAVVGGSAISFFTGMTLKRSCIAAGLYLLFQIGFELVILFL